MVVLVGRGGVVFVIMKDFDFCFEGASDFEETGAVTHEKRVIRASMRILFR